MHGPTDKSELHIVLTVTAETKHLSALNAVSRVHYPAGSVYRQ